MVDSAPVVTPADPVLSSRITVRTPDSLAPALREITEAFDVTQQALLLSALEALTDDPVVLERCLARLRDTPSVSWRELPEWTRLPDLVVVWRNATDPASREAAEADVFAAARVLMARGATSPRLAEVIGVHPTTVQRRCAGGSPGEGPLYL